MAFSIFRNKRKDESPDGPYDVYPLHFLDRTGLLSLPIMGYNFLYDEILDPHALYQSLARLMDIGDWRKCGGRLRKNASGHLELHVPKTFTPSYPPINYSHVSLNQTVREHPLASRLPKNQGAEPCIVQGIEEFTALGLGSNSRGIPLLKNHLKSNLPLLSLIVTSFKDATLVSLHVPHCLLDGMGVSGLLTAWSNTLAQREDLVKPVAGAKQDVMEAVSTCDESKGPYILEKLELGGLSFFVFLCRFLWDRLVGPPAEPVEVYLSSQYLAHLRQIAESEIKKRLGDQTAFFISDGDIITAWGSQMVLLGEGGEPKGTMSINNAFDSRSRLPSRFLAPDSVFLQNMILPTTSVLSREETREASLGIMALRVRESILEQTSTSQVARIVRITNRWVSSVGAWPMFGFWNTRLVTWTNWTKGKFVDAANFGAAVTREEKGVAVAKASTFWASPFVPFDLPKNNHIIYGKDAQGNYRLQANWCRKTIYHVEQVFMDFKKQTASRKE
ncbi:hypothetical protein B0I35DRAFT_379559 [Stachybotrys elegans]|uniref:Uncharacterized protein n=1 Tax=Stachybotrys elegans TaxID=80388 RepID=A0A8K0SI72_9HYPO|nr:hypothetical protein B0I35DRAFT_379559 [Stachybotrys elegans]